MPAAAAVMSAMPSLTVNGATHGGGRSRGGSGPGPGSGGLGAAPGVALASPNSTSERMYSAKQLTDALRSGLAAVKEQLQVLAILDGTALSWPGVSQAVDDMEFLTDMCSQTTNKLEAGSRKLQAQLDESRTEATSLREALGGSQARAEALQVSLNGASKELRDTRAALDDARRELQQTRQEVWALEKQRADVASELDRTKQDLDYSEGELRTARATVSEQSEALSGLKEELAARRSDVGHLQAMAKELRAAGEAARAQAAANQEALAAAQATLQHVRGEKQHYEKECGRLADEAARLGSELERVSREVARLKEWNDVIKKVEADKLREEQEAHARSRTEATARGVAGERAADKLKAEIRARDERIAARDTEIENHKKAASLLQLQIKDLQKQLSAAQGDLKGAVAAREEQRGAVARLQADLQRMRLEAAQRDKERALAESQAREAAAAERAKVQSKLDEAVKEAALARTLAEGWQRDVREAEKRTAAEAAKGAALHKELQALRDRLSGQQVESVRNGAAAEQQVASLREQLAAKDEEARRVKYDAASVQMQLEKAIERLQREVDASAQEVARLKAAESEALFTRLPPVAQRALAPPGGPGGGGGGSSIHEDLEALRRALRERMAAPASGVVYSAGASLPVLPGGAPGGHMHRGAAAAAAAAAAQQSPGERPSHLRNKTR